MDEHQERAYYAEIAALLGAVAKALDITDAEAARAIEEGRLTMTLETDENGHNYVLAGDGERRVRIYPGAIRPEA